MFKVNLEKSANKKEVIIGITFLDQSTLREQKAASFHIAGALETLTPTYRHWDIEPETCLVKIKLVSSDQKELEEALAISRIVCGEYNEI